MMNSVVIQFKKLNHTCIDKILREKLNYILYPYQKGEEIFCFEGWNFMRRFGKSPSLEREAQRLAFEIGEYGFVSNVRYSYDCESDRYRIVVIGRETLDPFAGGERIPKTFDVHSGYSKDGRLRTVVHWEDGVKTDVYLKQNDLDDIYLAISYCYVKRKFGNMSHFRRIVERNTKGVTDGVNRFIYGGDSTLLITEPCHFMDFSIYDQVALYLAISYLGDTDQWLTEEDIKRLEDSINE